MNLNQEQIKRYTRHILLPEIGVEGQKKLLAAKVLVVGAGGLGCPISLYLAAAGVGTIGLVDFDTIDASNLQRQILFTTEDIGKSKVEVAAKRLKALNPDVTVNTYAVALKSDNIMDILKKWYKTEIELHEKVDMKLIGGFIITGGILFVTSYWLMIVPCETTCAGFIIYLLLKPECAKAYL